MTGKLLMRSEQGNVDAVFAEPHRPCYWGEVGKGNV